MKVNGFTLIELVATLLIIGVASVVILPRFVGTSTFAEHALRDEVVSLLRFAQQRAMYDNTGLRCYGVVIDSVGASVRVNGAALSSSYSVALANNYSDISITPLEMYFDGSGDARLTSCNGPVWSASTLISIVGSKTLTFRIYPSGYAQLN